jgi:hypothetical protein
MTDGGAFLIEDFVHSIAAQLDRVQDALRLKAVNRPLTYALKDFSLDLHMFPEVDGEGHVRFRTAGANETGASTVHLVFTTITRPMIEENTVSLQSSQGPGLEESGLAPAEQRKLEQLGVRNVAQLQKLQKQTSSSTIQRLAGVPAERLRLALDRGRPAIDRVTLPAPRAPIAPAPLPRPSPAKPPPATPVATPPPPATRPPPQLRPHDVPRPVTPSNPVRVRLEGRNFLGASPRAKLDGRPVPIASIDDDAIEIDLPEASGALSIALDDGDEQIIQLGEPPAATAHAALPDPWSQP